MPGIQIGTRIIDEDHPTYFIADIAANHDGDLDRAIDLIHLAAEAGADAAKFQNFQAEEIVSARGFSSLKKQISHQAKWKKPVVEVYRDASVPWEWTPDLKNACGEAGIDYFSTPYDFGAVDMLDSYVPVYKIGSGDITWHEMLKRIAGRKKPVLLATGASDIGDVQRAVDVIKALNPQIVLMQCNTNYSASRENFRHINLNVLRTFRIIFPDLVLGLSDHTKGHATVLGAVALGARVIEKHFTDDASREGPDHGFSMTPPEWREMVDRTRELELALGSTVKKVEKNELETVVVQRRCLRASGNLKPGTVLTRRHISVLRPAPGDAIMPYDIERLIGRRLTQNVPAGEYFRWTMFEPVD
jgi:N-acetylneuraminate synthase